MLFTKRRQNLYMILRSKFMIKAVIFDWIGTLYDRDNGPFPDAHPTLGELEEKKIKMGLISLSHDLKKRMNEIHGSGLRGYFYADSIIVDLEKDAQQYLALIHQMRVSNRETLVVDDRTIRGIKIGNELRCSTAWIPREYAHETPNEETGQPTHTISTVKDILKLIN